MATKKKIATEQKEKEGKITVHAKPAVKLVEARVKESYFDKQEKKNVYYGQIIFVSEKRAKELECKGLVTILLE